MMSMPVLGPIIHMAETSRWSRTFANLYGAGVSMLEVLEIIANSSKNILVRVATKQVAFQINQGESLVSSIRSQEKVFPQIFIQLAEVGEEAGTLEEMLNRCAEYFDEEVDNRVEALQSIFEPLIIMVLGVIVGFILIAIYLPLFNLPSLS